MRTGKWVSRTVAALGVMLLMPAVVAQTPDGEPPAVESVCDLLQGGTPGLYGLCVAFCEAQDLEAIDIQDPNAEKRVPAMRLLEKYREKMQPGDPDMPCVQAGCPCWTVEELDATFNNAEDECWTLDGRFSNVDNAVAFVTDPVFFIDGVYFAWSVEFGPDSHVCVYQSPATVRFQPMTPEQYLLCNESIEAQAASQGLACDLCANLVGGLCAP